jgi:hypothetical protein
MGELDDSLISTSESSKPVKPKLNSKSNGFGGIRWHHH